LPLRFFVFLAFSPILAFAQQLPEQRETVVVTGTFEPMSLEEIDRAIRVLPVRSQSLVLNTLVDLLKLDPSLDLAERAPDGVQGDLSPRRDSTRYWCCSTARLSDPQSGHHNLDIRCRSKRGS
jgi:iron complex outermembrane receptor protein